MPLTSSQQKYLRFFGYITAATSVIWVVQVIYQTLETVFHRDIQTPRRELKIRRAAEYF